MAGRSGRVVVARLVLATATIIASTWSALPISSARAPSAERLRPGSSTLSLRPTGGNGDPQGHGYSVPSRFTCDPHFCVHWVESTADAPPLTDANGNDVPDQVDRAMAAFDTAWNVEVGRMGFRAPKSDQGSKDHGPDGRLDVYLADIGANHLSGYTATDDPHSTDDGYAYRDYSAYIVIDDDFSTAQLGTSGGIGGLRVTAAHEFFHAVQYAYDSGEDPWLMEGTAVWMEDQVASDVNANRWYLRESPLEQPWVPIDSSEGLHEYGAWIFWRFLSERGGSGSDPSIVKRVWELAADGPGDPNLYSARAVQQVLASRGLTFRESLAAFGVWNLAPSAFYSEGSAYPAAPLARAHHVTVSHPIAGWATLRLNHFATGAVGFEPGPGAPPRAALRLALDAPPTRKGSAARIVIFLRSGGIRVVAVALDARGDADVRVPFGSRSVRRVVLLYANAGASFRCWMGAGYSCNGRSRDDRMPFSYLAALVR